MASKTKAKTKKKPTCPEGHEWRKVQVPAKGDPKKPSGARVTKMKCVPIKSYLRDDKPQPTKEKDVPDPFDSKTVK